MTSNGRSSNEPRARLCHLRRWPNFIGYGFNLHCEKTKSGQYIGKVDPDSPAESAGLRENDRIVEVNFVPIGNENHKQVVTRIKEGVSRNNSKYTEEVILLVLDPEADDYFKSKSITVRSSDPNVEKRQTENRDVTEHSDSSPQLSNRSIGKADSPISRGLSPQTKLHDANRDYKRVTDFTGPTVLQTKTASSPVTPRDFDPDYDNGRFHAAYTRPSPTPSDDDKPQHFRSSNGSNKIDASPQSPAKAAVHKPATISPSQPSPTNGSGATLELKMSAAEYREQLKAQGARKRDPRQEQPMSMKQKHEVIDRL